MNLYNLETIDKYIKNKDWNSVNKWILRFNNGIMNRLLSRDYNSDDIVNTLQIASSKIAFLKRKIDTFQGNNKYYMIYYIGLWQGHIDIMTDIYKEMERRTTIDDFLQENDYSGKIIKILSTKDPRWGKDIMSELEHMIGEDVDKEKFHDALDMLNRENIIKYQNIGGKQGSYIMLTYNTRRYLNNK